MQMFAVIAAFWFGWLMHAADMQDQSSRQPLTCEAPQK